MELNPFSQLTREELIIFKRVSAPQRIQDFLVSLPINFEETMRSPRRVLREGKAHCLEGAMFAAAALWFHGEKPLLLDLETSADDESHTVALFRRFNHWGAISHTNHAVLRYREPVYRSIRELVMSYFHEYFLNSSGKKTLRSYSRPVDLSRTRSGWWLTADDDLWDIERTLEETKHYRILTPAMIRTLRPADPIELKAGGITLWRGPKEHKKNEG